MFSTTCEHALRALAYLARVPEGVSVVGRDLAVAADIPANYLSKILLALRNAGFIATTRGSGGGYRLSKPARDITLIEVVELFDKGRAVPHCLLGGSWPCSDDNPCTAHKAWHHVREAYTHFLQSTRLDEISF